MSNNQWIRYVLKRTEAPITGFGLETGFAPENKSNGSHTINVSTINTKTPMVHLENLYQSITCKGRGSGHVRGLRLTQCALASLDII